VVVLAEVIASVHEQVYIRAHFGRFWGVRLERDEGQSASRLDGIQVLAAQVDYVCCYFRTPDVLGGLLDEWDEVGGVVGGPPLHSCETAKRWRSGFAPY